MTNSSTLLNNEESRSQLKEKQHGELAHIIKKLSHKNLSRLLLFAKGLLKNGD